MEGVIHNLNTWWHHLEKNPQRTGWFCGVSLAIIAGICFLLALGSTPLVDETEPLFAEAARQMTVTGDWITPYFNQETRFDKPPLIYWLMAIAYNLIGVNEWAVRLPSALSAISLMVLVFITLRRCGLARPKNAQPEALNSRTSQRQLWLSPWIASALCALNIQTIAWARTGVSDMLLSGCMGGAMLCFFCGYTAPQEASERRILPNGWYIAFYTLLALAVLAKGPVGIVLPGLTIIPFLLYVGQFRTVWRESKPLLGALWFALLTVPWYVLVILDNGQDYIDSFFGYHNVERFTQVVNEHSAPWFFYFLVVLVGFLPWSVYLPWAIARLRFWQPQLWRQQPRTAHLGIFALAWFTSIFVFFTIAVTKLPSYVLPLLPAAAILVALLWSDLLTRESPSDQKPWGMWWTGGINGLFLLALGIACWRIPQFMGFDPAAPNWDQVVDQTPFPEIGAVIWCLGAGAIALCLILSRYRHWILLINLVVFTSFLLFSALPLLDVAVGQRQNALKELSLEASQVIQPEEQMMMIGFWKPSIVFYSHIPTLFFSHTPIALKHWREEADQIEPEDSLLLISYPNSVEQLNLQPQDYEMLAEKGAYQLFRFSPRVLLERNP
ncbi:ArnT family glycosyltransferase [Spirulina subsalsa]|uniref:ArnT family glycosyltransferase n=1 Tax=Spirulina subsalsa TaxID=54311 RepID=UPI0038B3DF53